MGKHKNQKQMNKSKKCNTTLMWQWNKILQNFRWKEEDSVFFDRWLKNIGLEVNH